MKVWAVIHSDYEEFTTKHICATKEVAYGMAKVLNDRLRFFDTEGSHRDINQYPKYVVCEFDVMDELEEPEFPAYAHINIECNWDIGDYPNNLVFRFPSILGCEHATDVLPYYAKEIIISVIFDGGEPNDITFGLFTPINKTDTPTAIIERCTGVIINAVRQMVDKGYTLRGMEYGDVTKFNSNVWKLNEYGTFCMALAKVDNPLMANAKVDYPPSEVNHDKN